MYYIGERSTPGSNLKSFKLVDDGEKFCWRGKSPAEVNVYDVLCTLRALLKHHNKKEMCRSTNSGQSVEAMLNKTTNKKKPLSSHVDEPLDLRNLMINAHSRSTKSSTFEQHSRNNQHFSK